MIPGEVVKFSRTILWKPPGWKNTGSLLMEDWGPRSKVISNLGLHGWEISGRLSGRDARLSWCSLGLFYGDSHAWTVNIALDFDLSVWTISGNWPKRGYIIFWKPLIFEGLLFSSHDDHTSCNTNSTRVGFSEVIHVRVDQLYCAGVSGDFLKGLRSTNSCICINSH